MTTDNVQSDVTKTSMDRLNELNQRYNMPPQSDTQRPDGRESDTKVMDPNEVKKLEMNEDVVDEDNTTEESSDSNDLKERVKGFTTKDVMKASMNELNELNQMYELYVQFNNQRLNGHGFSPRILDDIELKRIRLDDINDMDVESIKSIFNKYYERDNLDTLATVEKAEIMDAFDTPDPNGFYTSRYTALVNNVKPESVDDIDISCGYKALMILIKGIQLELYDLKDKYKKTKEELNSMVDQVQAYNVSKAARDSRNEIIESFKNNYETLPDGLEKTKLKRKIDFFISLRDMSFVYSRIVNVPDEKKRILKGFFSQSAGRSILQKFNAKIAKFGYKPEIYKLLFNLEEKYLEEDYHPFNNLFLFQYIRLVAYGNPYDERDVEKVQILTSNLLALLYKQFADEEAEEEFKDVIRKYDSFFYYKKEYFRENNASYPLSSYRIEAAKQAEEQRKESLISALKILDPDRTLGWNEEMSSTDLKGLYIDAQKILDNNQHEDFQKLTKVTQTNDGVKVVPNAIDEESDGAEEVETVEADIVSEGDIAEAEKNHN